MQLYKVLLYLLLLERKVIFNKQFTHHTTRSTLSRQRTMEIAEATQTNFTST